MRFVILSLLILIALISPSLAGTEDVSIGPFNVSFDMNTKENYSLHTEEEILQTVNSPNCTEYEVKVLDPSGQPSVTISIFYYQEPWDLDIKSFGESMASGFFRSKMGRNDVDISYRKIDGYDGVLISARDSNMPEEADEIYSFAYVIDDRTNVDVLSFYDWDDGSKPLIDSIHITHAE